MKNRQKSPYDIQDAATYESRATLNPLHLDTINVEEGFGISAGNVNDRMHNAMMHVLKDKEKQRASVFTLQEVGKAVEELFTYRELTFLVSQFILDHTMNCQCEMHRRMRKDFGIEVTRADSRDGSDVLKTQGNA